MSFAHVDRLDCDGVYHNPSPWCACAWHRLLLRCLSAFNYCLCEFLHARNYYDIVILDCVGNCYYDIFMLDYVGNCIWSVFSVLGDALHFALGSTGVQMGSGRDILYARVH